MFIELLEKKVAVSRTDSTPTGNFDAILPRIVRMAEGVSTRSGIIDDRERKIFHHIDQIIIFDMVVYDGIYMSRSFIDIKTKSFFWSVNELMSDGYSMINRIPSYYYHDGYHIQQWLDGKRSQALDARVDREVEATAEQILIARKLKADQLFLDFLEEYRSDRKAIEARLREGVGTLVIGKGKGYLDHAPILELERLPELKEIADIPRSLIIDSARDDPWR